MAVTLVGYVCAMVAALAVFVTLIGNLTPFIPTETSHITHHLRPPIAALANTETKGAPMDAAAARRLDVLASKEADIAAYPKHDAPAAADKIKPVRQARRQTRKSLPREYTTALGYAQEQAYAPQPFEPGSLFGAPRW